MADEYDKHDAFEQHSDEQQEQEVAQEKAVDAEQDAWKDRFMRVTADFENYKRRMVKERLQWGNSAQVEMLLSLLPIINNVDRALAEQQSKNQSPELQAWFTGLELIAKSLHKFLDQFEVELVNCTGEFDPTMHEALMHIENSTVPSGNIVQVLEPGYLFKKAVLRPAKVAVAK